MRMFLISAAVLLGLGGIIAATATYTVAETEQALILRFGTAVDAINEPGDENPGLHFRAPFVDNVIKYDKRNLEFDLPPEEILDVDQERIVVDAFLRFKITNPLRIYQTVRDERGLRDRLRPIMQDSVRGVIASVSGTEVISGQRAELMDRIESAVAVQVANQDLGIAVIDVRIKRADLPQQITEQVFQRMRSERQQQAQLIRSQGNETARQIRADAERQATVIVANA